MSNKNDAKALLSKLQSGDSKKTTEAIELFRKSGNIETLPHFIEAILTSKDEEVSRKGLQVLYDIKHKDATNTIFNFLFDEKYLTHQTKLVAVLWESGMSCDDRLEDLTRIAIQGNSDTTLEALTVIENIDAVYSFEDISELKMNIIEAMENDEDELKNQLLNSLCIVLDGMIA